MERFDIDKAHAERKARIARRAEVQAQIRNDQAANAKRDAKALEREREWYRQNRGEE